MTNDGLAVKGDRNIQVAGDNNSIGNRIVINHDNQPLTKSFIHDLLDIVCALPKPNDDSYPLPDLPQIHEKLRFNNAFKYMDIIDNHSDDFALVDETMKDYPNSEDIVKRLRDMFFAVAARDSDGKRCVGDGDQQLDEIKDKLIEVIRSDASFDAAAYKIEKIEQFCIALIAGGVARCKILEPPV
jgi:hypothetical protein